MNAVFQIRSGADLDQVLASYWTRQIHRIALAEGAAAGATPVAEQLVRRIDADLRACGCVVGAVFCVAGLAYVPWGLPRFVAQSGWGWLPAGATAFAVLILLAAMGKAIGMMAAEVRLRRNSRRLRCLLVLPEAQSGSQVERGMRINGRSDLRSQ